MPSINLNLTYSDINGTLFTLLIARLFIINAKPAKSGHKISRFSLLEIDRFRAEMGLNASAFAFSAA